MINVRYLIYLDGDHTGSLKGERVKYLPLPEIEDLFLRDPSAIHAGFESIVEQEHPDLLGGWKTQWPVERIAEFVTSRQKTDKGKKVLIDLAHEMKLDYRAAVYGPAIAKALHVTQVEFLRKDFTELFS